MSKRCSVPEKLKTQVWSNEIINKKYFLTNEKLAEVTPVLKRLIILT